MKKVLVVLALSGALVLGMMPGIGNAKSAGGAGAVAFQCTVLLTFPAPNSSTKTNCDGTAVGAGITVSPSDAFIANGVSVYNINYDEPCVISGQPPAVGTASGVSAVYGTGVLSGPGTVLANFAYTRVGVTFIATLSNVTFVAGTQPKGTTPKATATGAGASAGVFTPDPNETLGVCGASQQNHITITGVAAVAGLPNS
jgi:hypothetical protein